MHPRAGQTASPEDLIDVDALVSAYYDRSPDVDDPAHGIVAPEARATPAHDFDLIDAEHRHAVPVHPAAERVVQGNVIGQDERPAGTGGREAPQRDALSRRVRDAGGRAPKETEAEADETAEANA